MSTDRPYEALAILKPAGTDAEMAQSVKLLEEPIRKVGGQIDNSASWGRRRLAYRISRQNEGVYHLLQFRLVPAQLDEVKRALRLNEHIIRFLILNRTNHHAAPQASAAAASER